MTPMHSTSTNLVQAFAPFWRSAGQRDRPAIIGSDRQLSYAELADAVGLLAGKLKAEGISEGDRVALAMQRSVDLAVALLAVLVAGACPCVVEPKLGREETLRRFSLTKIGWVLLDTHHAGDESLNEIPGVRRVLLAALPQAPAYWASNVLPDAPAFLLFTSGSSGKPKGVLQSHRGLWLNALGVITHSRLSAKDRLLHVMPLYHTNGVNNQLFAALLAGSAIVLAERFKAEDMPGLMERYRPTIITGVPTMYSRMLACEFSQASLLALRMARCGSAPITEELHRRVEAKLGMPLVVSYGLSEATCTSTMNPPKARRIGSVGTVLQGQNVCLLDGAGQVLEGAQREGEICISGDSLMLGYLDEQSDGQPRGCGDVLHTGDLGRFDAQGYLFITGRIKDVIIRGGENLSPTLIESVLVKVPGVHACCVVGRADPDLGEVPYAFVVRMPDYSGMALTEERLGAAVMAELSRIHKPVHYFYVDALPENSVGKVDRKALALRLAVVH